MYANCPWVIQGTLLILVCWRPNMVFQDFHVLSFPTWVQLRNLPLEYHTLDFAKYLGSIISLIEWIDWSASNPKNMRFLKLKIRVKPQSPLFMGFMLKLDEDRYQWIQCKYGRCSSTIFHMDG